MKRDTIDALVVGLLILTVLGIVGSITYLRYSQCRDDGYNATTCTSILLGRDVVLQR